MGQFCALGFAFFLLLASLSLTMLALLTDNWYKVTTDNNADNSTRTRHNYHFGLWRICYDDMPQDIASDDSYHKEGSCIFIYKQLIQKNEDSLDDDSQLRIHLSRLVLGGSIAAAACLLFALLSLLCGMWPSARQSLGKRGCVLLSGALLMLAATMCSMASGISFIAVRDLDNTVLRSGPVMPPTVPAYASQSYDWSFMAHWVATGLAFFDSFVLICMLRNTYLFVNDNMSKMHDMDSF